MVVLKPWFRLAVICLTLLLLFLALYLPPLWTTSPPGFLPIIRVSGVDLTQAWLAKRRARAAATADEAFYWWQVALGNNGADIRALRGSLEARRAHEPNVPHDLADFLRQTEWLLRLGGTNLADLAEVASAYARYRLDDRLVSLLGRLRGRLTPALTVTYLTTLFDAGRMEDFVQQWQQADPSVTQHPDLALYHAAYLAGWGDAPQRASGEQRLAAAQNDPQLRLLAGRLQLIVSARRGDATAYGAALDQLQAWRSDTLPDHVGYWRLLDAAGRRAEAQELARTFGRAPVNPYEAVKLAEVLDALDQPARASAVLVEAAEQFRGATAVWIAQGDLLVRRQAWDELLALAPRMRSAPGIQDQLTAFSYYLEGRAEQGHQRPEFAARAFAKATQFPFEDPALGLRVAADLARLGHAPPAKEMLLALEAALGDQSEFWDVLLEVAVESKDLDLALRVGPRALASRSTEASQTQYARALVGSRQRPEEALNLTRALFDTASPTPSARVLHGLALLENNQTAEAERVLTSVPANKLVVADAAAFHLAWFGIHMARQHWEPARQAAERIDRQHLWPSQIQWLNQKLVQLPPPGGGGS